MISKLHEAREEEGFTLIELLVVIIIIGILAAIAIPTFLGQRERARRGAVQSDLRNLAINAETYFTDEQSYDDFTEGNDFLTFTPSDGVVLQGYHATDGFCVVGYYLAGDFDDAIDDSDGGDDQLPADDGGFWVYDSNGSPQLQDAVDAGLARGEDCSDLATSTYTQGSGDGGNASQTTETGTLDGRQ